MRLPADVRWKARMLRVAPQIDMANESVSVSVILFSKWGGFSRYTVERRRAFPHVVTREAETNLVAYDCHWLF